MFISFLWGVFVRGVFGKGGFCPGGFCPGVYVRGVFVRGFFVLIPLKQSLECKYMYCKYLRNVKTYDAEIWYSMLIYDADFCYDIDI